MVETNELNHHGILGMKWGVRRYQNEDGSLTSAGKKRYNDNVANAKNALNTAKSNYNKALKEYNKRTAYGSIYNADAQKVLDLSLRKYNYAKQDLTDEKIKTRLTDSDKKSKRQLELEKNYAEKGMTSEESAIAAYKRVRTEKAIAVTAGITIAAAAAYVAYKHYDNTVDRIIKSDSILQNISTSNNKGVADAFYASINKTDNLKYRGLISEHLQTNDFGVRDKGISVFETKFKVNSGLKVASPKNAENMLNDLVRNDENFAKSLKNNIQSWVSTVPLTEKQASVFGKAVSALDKGKIDKNVYDALNISLVDHTPEGQYISDKFYEALKSKGYDAIRDINDKKYSGYNTKTPLIVFNGVGKTRVDSIRNLHNDEIDAAVKKGRGILMAEASTEQLVKNGAALTAFALGAKATKSLAINARNDRIVKKYRSEHPNTKLSYKEIVRMYENSK